MPHFPEQLRILSRAAAAVLALLVLAAGAARGDAPRQSARPTDNPNLLSRDCATCHKVDSVFSHPVGITPQAAIPDSLPLENGKLTCTTCHESGRADHAAAAQNHAPLLRVGQASSLSSAVGQASSLSPTVGQASSLSEGAATGRMPVLQANAAFCAQCHNSPTQSRAAMHGSAIGRAHLCWPGRNNASPAAPTGELDADSRACLSCHDGTVAPDVSPPASASSAFAANRPHPIGVRYDQPAAGLTPAPMLDPRIRLFGGNVGCGSCHSPYSRNEKLLVISNDRSGLCLSCHQDR